MATLLNLACAVFFMLCTVSARPSEKPENSAVMQIMDSLHSVLKINSSTLVPKIIKSDNITEVACRAVKSFKTLSGHELNRFEKIIKELSAFSHTVKCTVGTTKLDLKRAVGGLYNAFQKHYLKKRK